MFDIYTIIFLALAVFIFLRLRSVLGQRTGRERPPYDPYSARDAVRSPATDKSRDLAAASGVSRHRRRPAEPAPPLTDRWKDIAESGSSVAAGLDAIVAADPSFDAKHFITGARAAYEMIVTAFAEGDRRQIEQACCRAKCMTASMPLSPNAKVAAKPRSRGSFRSTARRSPAPSCARARRRSPSASSPSSISATRGRTGDVIDGDAEKVTDVTDVWTFARDVSSRDPNWKVVATEAGQ